MVLTTQPKNLSTTESILDQLRNDINNFVYDEQFITEAAISTRFQVSRTPAREALNTLCQEGILEKIPRKGFSYASSLFLSFNSSVSTVPFWNAAQWSTRFVLLPILIWKKSPN